MARARRLTPAAPAAPLLELAIAGLGAGGDGVASLGGARLFVPLTVPGDRVRARRVAADRAEAVEWLERGPDRAEPPCPHFGPCGGCAAQHLRDDAYAAWKAGLLADALRRRGLAPAEIRPLWRGPARSRRRGELAAVRRGARVEVGFHARQGRAIAAIESCLVLAPAVTALLPRLPAFLATWLADGESADLLVTATAVGLDLVVTRARGLDLAARETLAGFAAAADLARLSWRGAPGEPAEIVAERRRPRVDLADEVAVWPPPGAFLQASAEGERAIVAAVREAVGAAARLADLHAGCGTLALTLAAGRPDRRVRAVEGDAGMAAALAAAAQAAGLGGRVSAEVRDLARRPLRAEELAGLDAVVFDPPFAGARAQAEEIARARVPVAVAVSCNPATLARDVRLLVAGGYRLVWAQPIDQFPWSAHLEAVALLRR